MSKAPVTLSADATAGESLALAATSPHRLYPVVDRKQRLAGIMKREQLAEADAATPARELMEQPRLVATASDPVLEVIKRMQLHGVDRCPVIDAAGSRHVVGFLSPSDILRARMELADQTGRRHFELFEGT